MAGEWRGVTPRQCAAAGLRARRRCRSRPPPPPRLPTERASAHSLTASYVVLPCVPSRLSVEARQIMSLSPASTAQRAEGVGARERKAAAAAPHNPPARTWVHVHVHVQGDVHLVQLGARLDARHCGGRVAQAGSGGRAWAGAAAAAAARAHPCQTSCRPDPFPAPRKCPPGCAPWPSRAPRPCGRRDARRAWCCCCCCPSSLPPHTRVMVCVWQLGGPRPRCWCCWERVRRRNARCCSCCCWCCWWCWC